VSDLPTGLPHTKTNDAGEDRFENIPWLSRYTIYAEDHTKKATTIGAHPNPSLSSESPSAPINSTEDGVGKTATMLKTGFAPKRKFLAW
jgi:hypothetical protein